MKARLWFIQLTSILLACCDSGAPEPPEPESAAAAEANGSSLPAEGGVRDVPPTDRPVQPSQGGIPIRIRDDADPAAPPQPGEPANE